MTSIITSLILPPDFCDIDQGDAQQTGGEPAGGGKAEAAADHCQTGIIAFRNWIFNELARNISTALTRGQRNKTTLVVMEAINLSSKKVGEPWMTWRD